jgi:hypothetical protein
MKSCCAPAPAAPSALARTTVRSIIHERLCADIRCLLCGALAGLAGGALVIHRDENDSTLQFSR